MIRFHFLLSGKFWIEISQGNTIFSHSKNKNSGCTRFSRCTIFISWIGINTTRYVDWLNSKSSIESKRIKICWDKNLHGIVDKQFTINSLSRFSLVEKKKKKIFLNCVTNRTQRVRVCAWRLREIPNTRKLITFCVLIFQTLCFSDTRDSFPFTESSTVVARRQSTHPPFEFNVKTLCKPAAGPIRMNHEPVVNSLCVSLLFRTV